MCLAVFLDLDYTLFARCNIGRQRVPYSKPAQSLVHMLRNNGKHVCIISRHERAAVDPILRRAELRDLVAHTTTRSDHNVEKTDPDIFSDAFETLRIRVTKKVAPEECLLVGYHPVDLLAGTNAKMETVIVRNPLFWPPAQPALLDRIPDDHTIRGLWELQPWMREHGKLAA